jgi:hypothetical protein
MKQKKELPYVLVADKSEAREYKTSSALNTTTVITCSL